MCRSISWVAQASRLLVRASSRSRTFLVISKIPREKNSKESSFRRDTETSTRDACATRTMASRSDRIPIDNLSVSAFNIPTDSPEADGTYEWESTTIVLVELTGAGKQGLGYTYADAATAKLIDHKLKQ